MKRIMTICLAFALLLCVVPQASVLASEAEYVLTRAESRDKDLTTYVPSGSGGRDYYTGVIVNYDLSVKNYSGDVTLSFDYNGAKSSTVVSVLPNKVYPIEVTVRFTPDFDIKLSSNGYGPVTATLVYTYHDYSFSAIAGNNAPLTHGASLVGTELVIMDIFVIDTPSAWAKDEVARTVSEGFVAKKLQTSYAANITREDFCVVLARVLEKQKPEWFSAFKGTYSAPGYAVPFNDVGTVADDNLIDICWLNSLEIVTGVGEGRFSPNGELTRQEAAVLLRRAAIKLGVRDSSSQTKFADQSDVASWAVDALGFVVDKGIMKGTGGNRFDPKGKYTREQAYTTIIRLYDVLSGTFQVDGITLIYIGSEVMSTSMLLDHYQYLPLEGYVVYAVRFSHSGVTDSSSLYPFSGNCRLIDKNGNQYKSTGTFFTGPQGYGDNINKFHIYFTVPETIPLSSLAFSYQGRSLDLP